MLLASVTDCVRKNSLFVFFFRLSKEFALKIILLMV